jgi:hypothetical protein
MERILWMGLGVLIALLVHSIIFYWRTGFGTLTIDHTDPEKDIYRFAVEDLDDLNRKSKIEMRIEHKK